MNHKFFVLSFVFCVLLLGSVSAAITDDNTVYYSYDIDNINVSTIIDLSNTSRYNGTCTMDSGCDTVPGLLNNASEFDAIIDRIESIGNVSTFSYIQNTGVFTMSFWMKNNGTGGASRAVIANTISNADKGFLLYLNSINELVIQITKGGGDVVNFNTGYVATNNFNHYALVGDGTNVRLYINNSLDSTSGGMGAFSSGDSTRTLSIGAFTGTASNYLNGTVDETGIWDRNISLSELSELFNGGIGFNPYAPPGPTAPVINSQSITPSIAYSVDDLTCNYNVTGSERNRINWYNNNTLLNLTETCYQEQANENTSCGGLSSGSYSATTTNLLINYTIPNNTIQASWQVFTNTIQNFTVPESCLFSNGGVLELSIELISTFNNTKSCYNGVSWEQIDHEFIGSSSKGGSTPVSSMYDGVYDTKGCVLAGCGTTVTGNAIKEEAIFWNITKPILNSSNFDTSDIIICELIATNLTANLSTSQNVSRTISSDLFTITYIDVNTTNPIENATVLITYPSGNTTSLTTNSSGEVNFSFIIDGGLDFGNYTFVASKLGFLNLTTTEEILRNTSPMSVFYNVSRASITFNIYDRLDNSLLSGINISIAMVGQFNDTTTTGILLKNNLSIISGDYTVYASADGYKTEIRRFTYTNQEELTIDFYLLNLTQSNTGTLFVTTVDSFFRKITDANVELLEYSIADLSFISVSECITNINAECSFNVELNTKTYYIRATHTIGGELFIAETSQSGEIITISGETRNLIFYITSGFIISPLNNLVYDINEVFVSNISSISVNYFTTDGASIEMCIEYFLDDNGVLTSITGDTYCIFTSSSLQNINTNVGLNRSNDYEARVYIKNTNNVTLETFYYPSDSSTGEIFADDMIGAMVVLAWLLILGLSIYMKNVTLFFVLGVFLSWAEVLIFPLYSMTSISVFKTVLCLMGLFVSYKRRDS